MGHVSIYRYSPLKSFLIATLFLFFTTACFFATYQGKFMKFGENAPPFVLYSMGFCFGIIALIACS